MKLYVFSGSDGSGKSTQIELLSRRLTAARVPVKTLWSRPGYTPLFSWFKTMLRRLRPRSLPKAGRSPEREQRFRSRKVRRLWFTISMLDLILYYAFWIRLLRLSGKTVICDRYIEDARLDFHLNFPKDHVDQGFLWHLLLVVAPKPDAAFLLLVPVEESVRRSNEKNEPFPDTPEVMQARFDYYSGFVSSGQWSVLDGLRSREAIHQEICRTCGLAR